MMAYMMFLDSDIILHVFPLLNVIDSPVIMRLHVPHLDSLHFVTVAAFEGVDENLAFVECCFKFFGCLRLTASLVSSMTAFIFLDDLRKLRFSLTLPMICGLCGLFVITIGKILWSCFSSFGDLSSVMSIFRAFSVHLCISPSG